MYIIQNNEKGGKRFRNNLIYFKRKKEIGIFALFNIILNNNSDIFIKCVNKSIYFLNVIFKTNYIQSNEKNKVLIF